MVRHVLPKTLDRLDAHVLGFLADGDHLDGGGLQLTKRGCRASWVFRFMTASGDKSAIGFGAARLDDPDTAAAGLAAARLAAMRARELLLCGLDPRNHRDSLRSIIDEARASRLAKSFLTLRDAAYDFHARVIKSAQDPTSAALWIAALENHVPPSIWNKRIDDITAPELLRALHGIRARKSAAYLPMGNTIPLTVRKVRSSLDRVFDDALFYGRCSSNPAAAVKRKLGEGQPKIPRGHYPALPYPAAPLLYAKLRASEGATARCLEFSLLTASRAAESSVATWPEFKLEDGVWTVPAGRMKGRKEHTVFLTERAIEIVRAQRGIDSTFVFSSINSRSDRPLHVGGDSMRYLLSQLDHKEKTTVHALCRATFSTWAYDKTDFRSDVIEACLAHQELDRVKAAYNRGDFQRSRAELLQAWNDFLAPDDTSNVRKLGAPSGDKLRLVSSQIEAATPRRYLRLRDVMARTCYCGSSIYQKAAAGTFPAPKRFGRMNTWLESEVDEWLVDRRVELAARGGRK